jgi:predicted amidohydrolase
MQVFACQFDIAWEDRPTNFAKVRQMLAARAIPPGSLIVLPEMFATGFSMNTARTAEPEQGETCKFLAAVAADYRAFVLGGVATHSTELKSRNEALVFDPAGNEIARYVKQQPFTLGGERDDYEAGTQGVVVECGEFRVAPLICYDLRFPELFRAPAFAGAQALVVIANWPQSRATHWLTLLRARAIENQAYVIGVNRSGNDPRLAYRGQSLIVDPQGNALAEAGEGEELLTATLDLKSLEDYRRKFPALKDLNPDHFRWPNHPRSEIL